MNKKLLVEFIGTFFLVLTVAFTGDPLAIGGVLIALVYMGGYISGAHYNPAVTVALLINKKISSQEAQSYILTQFIAAIVASATFLFITGDKFSPTIARSATLATGGVVEILFTFLLATVVLHTAVTDKTKNNHYYGLAIGLSLMVGAFAGGPISGGAFNPAVGAGPLLFDLRNLGEHLSLIFFYLITPTIGGALAGWVYRQLQ